MIYNNIIQGQGETAELCVRHKPRNKKSLWEGKIVVEKRGALQEVLKGTSEEVRPKALKVEDTKALDRSYAEEQEEYINGKIQETERAHESYKTGFRFLVNEISGREVSSRGRIRASCPKEHIKL